MNNFKTQLEEIEFVLKKSKERPDYFVYTIDEYEARKSQLLADEEIHKQEMKEFIFQIKQILANKINHEDLFLNITQGINKLTKEMIGEEKGK